MLLWPKVCVFLLRSGVAAGSSQGDAATQAAITSGCTNLCSAVRSAAAAGEPVRFGRYVPSIALCMHIAT
jgi:hypothetical protein